MEKLVIQFDRITTPCHPARIADYAGESLRVKPKERRRSNRPGISQANGPRGSIVMLWKEVFSDPPKG
jgi:hypothetical protein